MERAIRRDRRHIGLIAARVDELQLERVADPRGKQGRRWGLAQLLSPALVGLATGCRGLKETEQLTAELPPPVRKRLHIPRRVPDTTLRNTVGQLEPSGIRKVIHRQVKTALRRKQLGHPTLPWGVMAIDGKVTALPQFDDHFAQRHHLKNAKKEIVGVEGLVRTLTCCLTSSAAKVCIDAVPIPARTNEVGHFGVAFRGLLEAYGKSDLFRMITTDAGFTSAANAALGNDAGYAYVMDLKDQRRHLTGTAMRRLGHLESGTAIAETVDKVGSAVVTRRLWMAPIADVDGWPHLRRILRVQSERVQDGEVVVADRYCAHRKRATNYGAAGLNPAQWLAVVRSPVLMRTGSRKQLPLGFWRDPGRGRPAVDLRSPRHGGGRPAASTRLQHPCAV